MRTGIVVTMVAASMALTGTAVAGGWATVQMSAYPGNAEPRKAWVVDLTVLQHGVRPLEGVRPVFRIRHVRTGEERSFPAAPTATLGVYRATVVFPHAGRWDYEIEDGFGRTHTYAPVVISEAAVAIREAAAVAPRGSGGSDAGPAAVGIALGAAALAAALVGAFALARWRRRRPAAV